jgi:truncated hemoglobin YjbI
MMSGRYYGRPMQAHLGLLLVRTDYDRWLALLEQTANEVCPSVVAAYFIGQARRIADIPKWELLPG